MQTKDIIKKYRMKKILTESGDQEASRVYDALYRAVDIKLKDAEYKLNRSLEEITKLVKDSVSRLEDYAKKLEPKEYQLTSQDAQRIASQIEPKVVDRVVERTEIIKELPQITEITKNIENKDTPEQIVDKVNRSTSKILISSVKNLQEELDYLKKLSREVKKGGSRSGGGMGNTQHESKPLSSATTSVVTTYIIAAGGYALWVYYQGQMIARGVGYTVSNDRKTINLLFTPIDGTFCDIIYIR